ncbi:MAG: class I SAM-dependent methyltransferase [Candidatus Omnitrophica bacterium]|nr:class I SAM-dependent methyltransferase [Candidatus Omnitrophota bacterium]
MEKICPICRSTKFKLIGEKKTETYYRCNSCGVALSLEFWKSEVRSGETIYDEAYLAKSGKMHPKTTQRYYEFLEFMEGKVEEKNLVEVGFGNGQFLLAAKDRNWRAIGVEISSAACNYVTNELHLETICGLFEEVPIEPGSVDVVASMETIEHLYDPNSFIQRCHQVLKKGGVLFLTTPNENCLTRKLIGMDWRGYASGHTILFPYRTLKKFLEENGFRVIGGETRTIIPTTITNVYKNRLKSLLGKEKKSVNASTSAGNISLSDAQALRDKIDSSFMSRGVKSMVNVLLNVTGTGEKSVIYAEKT